jgi:hypothetical protein
MIAFTGTTKVCHVKLKKLATNEFHSREVWCELKSISTICNMVRQSYTTSGWIGINTLLNTYKALVGVGKLYEGPQNKFDISSSKFPANRPC